MNIIHTSVTTKEGGCHICYLQSLYQLQGDKINCGQASRQASNKACSHTSYKNK